MGPIFLEASLKPIWDLRNKLIKLINKFTLYDEFFFNFFKSWIRLIAISPRFNKEIQDNLIGSVLNERQT